MCGRYIIVSKVKKIETRFGVRSKDREVESFPQRFNLGPGQKGLLITSEEKDSLSIGVFGLTPHWSKKRMYLFNARAEGDGNQENDPNNSGARGIISKPAFRKSIRTKRCLIPADGFIEGPEKEKLSRPYLVHCAAERTPFAMAGIYEDWVDVSTGEMIRGFAIITTVSNAVTRAIGHHRSPVLLEEGDEGLWLETSKPLADALELLKPYQGRLMNAYPLDPAIKSPRNEDPELLRPLGPYVLSYPGFQVVEELDLFGMGETNARRRRKEEQ